MHFPVPPEAAGLRLDRFLRDRLKLSRTLLRKAKQAEGLLVDGQVARGDFRLQGGETVAIEVATEGRVIPEPMDLNIHFEDEYLLVVEKPPGIVVHPVRGYTSGTLANGVAHHLLRRGEPPVARPIQRIDRETSGLVLFAKDAIVASKLAGEMERHKLDRQYIAFVHGRVRNDEGIADVPMRRVWGHPVAREAAVGPRLPEHERLLAVAQAAGQVLRAEWTGAGQRAVTHWRVLRRWRDATQLALQLETGRTHQIRVHMAYLGYPLLGDELYGMGGRPGRQALHAETLGLSHPVGGERLHFRAPLPEDLITLVRELDDEEHDGP